MADPMGGTHIGGWRLGRTRAPGEHLGPVGPWQPTRALGRAVAVVTVLLVGGLALGRVDLVAIAVPVALATAVALLRRPTVPPTLRLDLAVSTVAEGQPVTASLTVTTATTLDLATARLSTSDKVGVVRGTSVRTTSIRAGEEVTFDVRVRPVRWGRHAVGPAVLTSVACDGMLVCRAQVVRALQLSALPEDQPFSATDVVPRAAGVIGSHRARRPGEGGELSGVRPFTAGDRLRRINWRVSLRAREMYVSATLSERDTDVVLLLDLLHEAGHSGGVDGAASSLDTSVRAAAALAEHYLSVGDRVGVVLYGSRLRFVPPRGGSLQLRRINQVLMDAEVRADAVPSGTRLMGPRVLPPRVLTVVLSPLVDERSVGLVAELAHRGQAAVVIDTLPPDVRPPRLDQLGDLAWRLWWLQRSTDVHRIIEVGVPVVPWQGAGSLDLVLRDVTRIASLGRSR